MPEYESLRLDGKVALVTGASRGIGRAVALELARQGAKVTVNYNASIKAAEEVVTLIKAHGGEAQAVMADVSNFNRAQELVKSTIDNFGGLDILVNNAGITRDMLIMMMSEEDWDAVQNTNLKSTFNCSKAAVRHMMRKRFGRIINITSVAGQMGNAGQTNYSASKAGQIGFTKALAREVAARNITVNGIAAGYIDTDIWNTVPEEAQQAALSIIPLGRKGQPEEIAYAVAFLASDQAAYITGQILGVDGGMAMM
ncbi:MAG: 3-oxoacyl-[acyl-carrier-protein] reductase [Anaerolineales bacterium]|nr:MAG: 3-oxoacyl-[acyl-carrier-protein] reductase [Anaerolineales bacterium]